MSWSFWILFGLVLLVVEMVTPGGFFTLFFGVAAILVAILARFGLVDSGMAQWLTFGILGTFLIAIFRPLIRKRFESKLPKVDQLVGQAAIAMETLDANGRGKVELRGTTWSALYTGTGSVLKGDRLRVTKVDGLSLVVEKE